MADNENPTRDELDEMSDDELKVLAVNRGLTVTSKADGGDPSRDDYLDALDPDDGAGPTPEETQGIHPQVAAGDARARAAQIAAKKTGGKAPRIDETIRGGRYVNTQGKFVNAHGQEIDDDGNVIDGTETPPPQAAR